MPSWASGANILWPVTANDMFEEKSEQLKVDNVFIRSADIPDVQLVFQELPENICCKWWDVRDCGVSLFAQDGVESSRAAPMGGAADESMKSE